MFWAVVGETPAVLIGPKNTNPPNYVNQDLLSSHWPKKYQPPAFPSRRAGCFPLAAKVPTTLCHAGRVDRIVHSLDDLPAANPLIPNAPDWESLASWTSRCFEPVMKIHEGFYGRRGLMQCLVLLVNSRGIVVAVVT
jgi:hypothetical protein